MLASGIRTTSAGAAVLAVVAALLLPHTAAFAQSSTSRVSVDSAGNQGNGTSNAPAISADGRYVAFVSFASNLVPGDTNGTYDIFLHDRQTAETSRVSVGSDGEEANGSSQADASVHVAVSDDGRFVAFNSLATNLGADPDTGGVFVHDRLEARTTLVSFNQEGEPVSGRATLCDLSGDGQFVSFRAGNRLFLRNVEAESTELVAMEAGCGALSADARFVAYVESGSRVVVLDRESGSMDTVSVTDAGEEAAGSCEWASISSDGRFVAFETIASNLHPRDDNGVPDVFIRDRAAATTSLVSRGATGQPAGGSLPQVSGEGGHVVYRQWTGRESLLVYDANTALSETVSLGNSGEHAEGFVPAIVQAPQDISSDGRHVVFESDASNLVDGDTNGEPDVFVRDRSAETRTPSAVEPARSSTASPGEEAENGGAGVLPVAAAALGMVIGLAVVAALIMRRRSAARR
jgi:Tol biopolymer transport system component